MMGRLYSSLQTIWQLLNRLGEAILAGTPRNINPNSYILVREPLVQT